MIDFATSTQPVEFPATFPKEGEYDDGRLSSGPNAYLMFASLNAGRIISKDYWGRLNREQQQYVRDSLASRGLTLFDRGDGMVTIEIEYLEFPSHAYCMRRTDYEFSPRDDRFSHEEQIFIRVTNVDSKAEARKILRKFVKFIQEYGLEIF